MFGILYFGLVLVIWEGGVSAPLIVDYCLLNIAYSYLQLCYLRGLEAGG